MSDIIMAVRILLGLVFSALTNQRRLSTMQGWWVGLLCMFVGEIGNFVAYGMAPASLVSPLGAITVISNAVLSKVMLNEPMPKGGHTCCSVGTPQRPVCMGVFVRLELKATQRPHYDQFVKYLPIKEACSEKKIPAQRIEHHQGQGHVCAESCESVSALASANEQGSHIGTGQVCQRSS